jgi:hypothetical protein
MMVDDSTKTKGLIMQKHTFVVEIVGDVDVRGIVASLSDSIDSVGEFRCVDHADTATLSDQGLKVWAKRKVGISLAAPKPVKAPKVAKAETATA